jgi:hypothetical protein
MELVSQLNTLAYRDEVIECNLKFTMKIFQTPYVRFVDRENHPQKQNKYKTSLMCNDCKTSNN